MNWDEQELMQQLETYFQNKTKEELIQDLKDAGCYDAFEESQDINKTTTKVKKERELRISLEPRFHDNPHKPYFWVIMEWHEENWVNSGLCGWEATPQAAWDAGMKSGQHD